MSNELDNNIHTCVKCDWQGTEEEKNHIPCDDYKDIGVECTESVCPECGSNTFFLPINHIDHTGSDAA